MAESRLFRSTDRGDTWQDRSAALPSGLNLEIAFSSDTEGWLSTLGQPATQCTFQSVGIAHTVDAAASWSQLVAAGSTVGLADRQCKAGLSFVDAQRGFLSAWDQNSRPLIYRTVDGGRSWLASRPIPDPPGFTTQPAGSSLRAGRVGALGTTLLVAASGTLDGRMVTFVYESSDGGASWAYAGAPPPAEEAGTVVFVTTSRWLVIGSPRSSRETTDGGRTWHPFNSDYSQAAPIAPEVVFGDALVGYATVRGAIQRTVDGGAHWTAIKTPGT